MDNMTLESFMLFCDNMLIAEETYRLIFTDSNDKESVSDELGDYFISKKDIEEHCAKKHIGLHIGVLLEKTRRSRFIGEFENKFRLVNEINNIKRDNLDEIVDCIVNSSTTSITIEKEYNKRIGNLYESTNNDDILGGVTCNVMRVIFGINRTRGYFYFKNAYPIPYKGFDEKRDTLDYTIFPQ